MGDLRADRALAVQALTHRQRCIAGLSVVGVALTDVCPVRQHFVSITGVQPAALMAQHQTAAVVAMHTLHLHPRAFALGLGKAGVKGRFLAHRPVGRGAQLHLLLDLTG
ncbi:hypothetical protein D9M73_211070 [compost metagenome]